MVVYYCGYLCVSVVSPNVFFTYYSGDKCLRISFYITSPSMYVFEILESSYLHLFCEELSSPVRSVAEAMNNSSVRHLRQRSTSICTVH